MVHTLYLPFVFLVRKLHKGLWLDLCGANFVRGCCHFQQVWLQSAQFLSPCEKLISCKCFIATLILYYLILHCYQISENITVIEYQHHLGRYAFMFQVPICIMDLYLVLEFNRKKRVFQCEVSLKLLTPTQKTNWRKKHPTSHEFHLYIHRGGVVLLKHVSSYFTGALFLSI